MSILLIFQVVCIIQHLMLYPIDTNIIITHIFHFPSLTYFSSISSLLYFTSILYFTSVYSTCHFQPVLILFSFPESSLFCFFSLNSNSFEEFNSISISNYFKQFLLLYLNSLILFSSLILFFFFGFTISKSNIPLSPCIYSHI